MRLVPPLRRDPIPEVARGPPGRPRYGYPLCLSQPNFEWHPYLPAVSSFHYPIFRGMTSAEIIYTGLGWKLRDQDILLWSSVEFVMLKLIEVAGSGRLTSLDHITPDWPEAFGYKRLHSAKKFAAKAKTASLNAFQRMLAYCSYTIASASTLALSSVKEEYRCLLFHPEQVDSLFKKIDAGAPDTEIHVLVKFLWATLGEIRRTSNFAGIVVHHHKDYDYPSVRAMHRYNVPVYTCWDNTLRLHSYSQYHQHHILKDWAPSPDDFRALEHSPSPTVDRSKTSNSSRYGLPPPVELTQRLLDPMDYVRQRKRDIEAKLATSDKGQSMRSRQSSAIKFGSRSHRGAHVYELKREEEVDQSTGEKIVYWERRRLDRTIATDTYEFVSPSQLWWVLFLPPFFTFPDHLSRYDCDLDQWNFCEEFDFEDHRNSTESDSEEDVVMFFENLVQTHADNISNNKALVSEDSEVLPDRADIRNNDALHLDGEYSDLCDPKDDGGTPLDHISQSPFFCNGIVLEFLRDLHFKVPERNVAGWRDTEDFLAKRYGLTELSGREHRGKTKFWSKKLGFNILRPDQSAVELYDSVVSQSQWPPFICDLSPEIIPNSQTFPSPKPGNLFAVSHGVNGYTVSIQDGQTRPWKLLISDPLTILQVERELWCTDDGNSLITNLLKKGIPFEVLHAGYHEAAPFLDHPGPTLHPTEKEPRLPDYFAYRHDLVDFLRAYPHAHAAALCAGGILWRIAVDALPLPSEDSIVGPFHRATCVSRTINGKKYWTPRLTVKEEQVVVGVYKWAESEWRYSAILGPLLTGFRRLR